MGNDEKNDRNHLKCLSPSSYRAASVDAESMFVCLEDWGMTFSTLECIPHPPEEKVRQMCID